MVGYKVDDGILILTLKGDPSAEARDKIFQSIAADPRVPLALPLLIDASEFLVVMDPFRVAGRVEAMIKMLGPKLGSIAALVQSPSMVQGQVFKTVSKWHGVQVGVFNDVPSARAWIAQKQLEAESSGSLKADARRSQ